MERSADVELLVAFTNSVDHDENTDDLTTPAQLSSWLAGHALTARRLPATQEDLTLALRLRDALHAAFVAHHDATDEDAGGLGAVAAQLPLRLAVAGGSPALEPVDGGVRGALARIVVAITGAVADGRWQRLKVCSASDCSWAYYDATKNRSRTWCEWGCGNKAKTRSYRARRRVASAGKPADGQP